MTQEVDLNSFLISIGFGFPETPEQLKDFNEAHKDFSFEADEYSIDPDKIYKAAKAKKKSTKTGEVAGVEYHKRTVLAAEIVFQLHEEWSMGHLKLQKLIYLCQNVAKMSIHVNFLKQAMGPYDPVLMRSLDKQLKQQKWFAFNQNNTPKYLPLENIGGHREWYERYYSDNLTEIDFIINLFKKMKTSQVELVATIYACWLEIIKNNEVFSEDLIVTKVYAWSEQKAKFTEGEIKNCIDWMVGKGIYPS
ncbi:MAG: hypothetical protein NVV82_22770 [Sporocytophaga sp.]|nr:hypothetical protein [Sporocytophaga sp.]